MHPLGGAAAKIARARQHLKALDSSIGRWAKSHPHVVRKYHDAETGEYVQSIHPLRVPPFERWGLLIGDCVHNARSALDYIAWNLAGARIADTNTQFPIYRDPAGFQRRGDGRIKDIKNGEARALITAMQPYNSTNSPDHSWLYILNELDARDKHKLISVVAPVFVGFQPGGHLLTETVEGFAEFRLRKGLIDVGEGETEILRYKVSPADRRVDIDLGIKITVAFGKGFPTPGGPFPVGKTLRNVVDAADGVVKVFTARWEELGPR